ncbi:MAG: ribosome biogenesis GTP-binding protein YihA/YsxC [Aquihabitans sp.]
MSAPLRFKFVTSGDDVYRLPPTRAEVAFLGRSNVGKSSLLNALANHKRLAHTSKTPGRTQLLNLFELGDQTSAVDLPGYGFASVPGKTRANWEQMIEGYLLEREALVMVLVLVDGEIGPTKLDVQMLTWLRSHGLPHTVVASKHDKVKSSKRGGRQRDLAEGCGVAVEDVVWVSAAKGTGIEDLRGRIHRWLAEGAARYAEDHDPIVQGPTKVVEPDEQGEYDDEDEWN